MLKLEQSRTRKELARDARAIAGRQSALYHGTRYPRAVLRMNMLFYSYPGSAQIAFTRSPEVAVHFASLDRDNDEGTGAVFVFSRSKLRNRYRLEPFHDPIWDTTSSKNNEMEERIWRRDIREVSRYLLGVAVFGTEQIVTPEKQRLNRLCQEQLALRAQGVEPATASEMVYGPIADLESLVRAFG